MKCKNCKSNKLIKIIKIGKHPISSVFYDSKKLNLKKYCLDLFRCLDCELVQLSEIAPLKKMYGVTYGYKSGISPYMLQHLKKKYEFLKKKIIFNKNSSILDIGSNDGSFLNFFSSKHFLVGIDPSIKKFKKNYKSHIYKINDFFSEKTILNHLKKKNQTKFDLISSFAIFYDIKNPNRFCKYIYNLLKENGVWVCEFSYLPLMLKNLTFDQICHEHVTYYSLKVFNSIIKKNNLKIINISFNEINGGSIEITCAKKESSFREDINLVKNVLKDETKITNKAYYNFNKRIDNTKKNITLFLKNYDSKKIIGYGASTKGNTIINFCSLTSKELPFICDENKNKINKFTPGSNIKIISKNKMRKLNPKFLLVLIWSFRSEVIKQEKRYILNGGSLVFPLPKFHVVDRSNYKSYLKKNFKALSYKY
jgi:2-polyprenyl-3-methyl-5-hydroxy-6-metoxy-1,4-benzoquinol methylase